MVDRVEIHVFGQSISPEQSIGMFIQPPLRRCPRIGKVDGQIILRLTSANDLRDIATSLDIQHGKHRAKQPVINEKYKDMTAPARQPDIYLKVLQGGQ